MISSVAYADDEMLSDAKTARPVKTFSRSESSSCSEIGRPNTIARPRASARPAGVRGDGRGFLGHERVRAGVAEVGRVGSLDADPPISRLAAMYRASTADHRAAPTKRFTVARNASSANGFGR